MARQRSKPLLECPVCHERKMRNENAGKINGKRACDDCIVDATYKRLGL